MKALRLVLLLFTVLTAQPVLADEGNLIPNDVKNYIGYGAIVMVLVLVLVAMVVLLHAFKVINRLLDPLIAEENAKIAVDEVAKPTKVKSTMVEKLLSLKPLSEERSLLIEHDYDGIQELDNPTPSWFMGLFYITIVFAVVYMLIYHVFGWGAMQEQEYVNEMTIANKEKEAFLAKSADRVDENTIKLSTESGVLTAGQAIYAQNCMPCHGDKGQGVIGPNLTDDFWLHGGKINDVFKIIKYGASAKGMPSWEKQLTPKQMADVANFIKSLHGTNPAGAKEPQGVKDEGGEPAKVADAVETKI